MVYKSPRQTKCSMSSRQCSVDSLMECSCNLALLTALRGRWVPSCSLMPSFLAVLRIDFAHWCEESYRITIYRLTDRARTTFLFLRYFDTIRKSLSNNQTRFSQQVQSHSHLNPCGLLIQESEAIGLLSTAQNLAPVARLDKVFPGVYLGRRRQDLLTRSDILAAIIYRGGESRQ